MKKRLLGLILALTCLLLPVLTSCSSGKDYVATAKVKPMTITLYGITGETTTEEAILEVQNKLNEYTEGNLSTRVLLRLFTEEEYYAKLDEAIAKAQAYKEEQKNKKDEVTTETGTEKEEDKEDEDPKSDRFEVKFEDEKGTQVDIFMVRGAEMLQKYVGDNIASALKAEEQNSIITKYVSSKYLALASSGTPTSGGNVDSKSTLYGIPCNYVSGDYTYLLVNKEIADNYGYAAQDVDTLDELANYLEDAAKDYSSYVTLYNAPELNSYAVDNTLIGGVIPGDAHAFTAVPQGSLLADSVYVNFYKNLNLFKTEGYLTEGDAYALPEDKKVAAAFIKGNAALPEAYEDEYIVVPYAKPCVEDLGTVFCVSTLASDVSRCLEVVSAIMTNVEYRNTLQYGVENKHYKINDYTNELEIISDEYSMNYADTGNMFLLKPNTSMSPEMLALAADNWALAKQQYRDAVVNPLTTPMMHFALTYYDETNFVSSGWYKTAYTENLSAMVSEFDDFKKGLKAELEEAQKKVDEDNEKNKDKEGYVPKVVDVEKITADFTADYLKDYEKYDIGRWYKAVLNGKVEAEVEQMIKDSKAIADSYESAKKAAQDGGTAFDEAAWYKSILSGKTEYSIDVILKDKKAYSDAVKAAKAATPKGEEFNESEFRAAYEVKVDVEDIVATGKAYGEALTAAKAEEKFDEAAFNAEYIKATVEEVNKKYTFAYTPGYTAEHIDAVKALTKEYTEKLMAYKADSEMTFEEHAAAVAAEYAENEHVKLLIDPAFEDSIVAQYVAWATGLGIMAAPAA